MFDFLDIEIEDIDYIGFTDDDAWMFLPTEITGDFTSVESLCE